VQAFGDEGLSGTGPKSDGLSYLYLFTTEPARSVKSAALGHEPGLLSLSDDEVLLKM
jgi:delta 1-pyrroline-5-carboxylate dehydrogenase